MLSIVTGTLNRRSYLPLLIENTVKAHDSLELILVDGGSVDGTQEFIKKMNHDRIKLIEVGKRSPYPHYMNLGIRNATYDFICQWNDDVLMVTPWKAVIEQLQEPYDLFIFSWQRGDAADIKDLYGWERKVKNWILFCASNDSCMNFGIYKKSVFKDIGLYSHAYQYYYADKDMSERARLFGKKLKPCADIHVFECRGPKRALQKSEKIDEAIFNRNKAFYQQQKIPPEVEKWE